MKFNIFLSTLVAFSLALDKCPADPNPCAPTLEPNIKMDATFFSDPEFKGESFKAEVNGPFGCTNLTPNFTIKSYHSTGSTKVFLHYGKDCIGHVLEDVQGGNSAVKADKGCPGSVFIKFNRYGSC